VPPKLTTVACAALFWRIRQSFQDKAFMPKMKTHKGASKRFKKTGTGKVARRHAFARHILTSKPRSRKRKLGQGVIADETDQAKLRTMLPY
jgi:large subunit ribosomal protein L35